MDDLFNGGSRRNGTGGETYTRDGKLMILRQRIGYGNLDIVPLPGKDKGSGTLRRQSRFLINPEEAFGGVYRIIGHHILQRVGNGESKHLDLDRA